jgi:F-type H+-transporting ATPase subunit b
MIFATRSTKQMTSWKKNIRGGLLVLLVTIVCGITGSLYAQDQSADPSQSQQQQPQQQQSEPHHTGQRSFGRQLAHETREAAGEEKDETEEFKQSPAIQFVARVTGLSVPSAYMLSVFFNFGVVAVLILWACAKYLPRVFRARTETIQKTMQEAQKASEEARRRLAEIESRLQKLDAEIGTMRNAAEKEAAAEEARLLAAAEEDKRKIVESAQHEIDAAAKSARRELTAYAADLAVALAKKQIQVDAATDQALVRNFAGQLSAYSSTSGPGSTGKDKN